MRVCILISTLLASALSNLTPAELQRDFDAWEKSNLPPGMVFFQSSAAKKDHFVAFAKADNFVDKHNHEKSDWVAGINEFSGMTEVEKAQSLGLNASTFDSEWDEISLAKRSLLTVTRVEKRAESVNYSHKLPGIKRQGGCSSCWTFAATAALEYQVNRRKASVTSLSEQQYLDCVYEGVEIDGATRDGCKGGCPPKCYKWTKDNKNMLATTEEYPYNGYDRKCNRKVKSGIEGYIVSGSQRLEKGDDNLLNAVMDETIGVISVAIAIVDSFYSYQSGVYSESKCSEVNHAVVVVGYGTEKGKKYFRVRNSWGTKWGDGGHINMARGSTTCCGLSDRGCYPLVTLEGDDSHDASDGGDSHDDGDTGGDENMTCEYIKMKNTKLKKVLKVKNKKDMNKSEAMKECSAMAKCAGVSCVNKKECVLSPTEKSKDSKIYTGYVKKCTKN